MPKYGMVIDLQKCVGCGACGLACKTENNTQDRANGQTFNWADFIHRTEGTFPNVSYTAMPVLCNHCSNPPCVEACPVTPKAMHKHDNGITMHNQKRCIGCQACQEACPYSVDDVEKERAEYSVISFNDFDKETYPRYRNTRETIQHGTASGAEISRKARDIPPHRTLYRHSDYDNVRRKGVVEKCILCEHRVKNGKLPYCVVACPASARIFGDLEDKNSEVSRLLGKFEYVVLKPEEGTKPNVYYVRSFTAARMA
jgi:Fe-S-cluster-containing dehydrogenase component